MPKTPMRAKAEKSRIPTDVLPLTSVAEKGRGLTHLNFRVSEAFHREFKLYAVQHGMSMIDLLQASFKTFKKTRGA